MDVLAVRRSFQYQSPVLDVAAVVDVVNPVPSDIVKVCRRAGIWTLYIRGVSVYPKKNP